MRIAAGSDHAGFIYKGQIIDHLESLGHTVVDLRTDSDFPVNYPELVHPVAELVASDDVDRG